MNDKIKIGSVWEQTTNGGSRYYSGKVSDNLKILIFENKSSNEKAPAFDVYFAPFVKAGEGEKPSSSTFTPPPADAAEWPEDD